MTLKTLAALSNFLTVKLFYDLAFLPQSQHITLHPHLAESHASNWISTHGLFERTLWLITSSLWSIFLHHGSILDQRLTCKQAENPGFQVHQGWLLQSVQIHFYYPLIFCLHAKQAIHINRLLPTIPVYTGGYPPKMHQPTVLKKPICSAY